MGCLDHCMTTASFKSTPTLLHHVGRPESFGRQAMCIIKKVLPATFHVAGR
jgi:hypothetical protein